MLTVIPRLTPLVSNETGHDWKPNLSVGYVTPYAAISGLFQSGDDYQLSNDMRIDGQSYDSMRYELGGMQVIPSTTAASRH